MKKSLFNRLFTNITVVLIIVFSISLFVGRFVIEKYYIDIKVNELKPELQNVIDEIINEGKSDINLNKMPYILKVYDINKNEMNVFSNSFKPIDKHGEIEEPYFEENIKISIEPFMDEVFSGKEIKKITNLKGIKGTSVVLGIPIRKDGHIIGGLFLLKPVSDFNTALIGFNLVFLAMSVVLLIVILILLYFSTKPLIIPLKDMAYNAKKMSQGEYGVRIKEKGYGEVEELADSFNTLAINLEEACRLSEGLEKTRRDYVANISHELRTPIASLRAMSETLLDGLIEEEEEKQRYYQIMLTESIRLQRLINDMLELSKLQSGNAYLNKSTVDIAQLINSVYEKFSNIAYDLEINLKLTDVVQNLPLTYTNSERIEQVLIILLDNAFKFTLEDGIVIISANMENEKVIISVEDTGEGITEEDIPYIFERFYKIDKSRTTQGTGLGLAIAKQIIESLDEKIWVTSKVGKGAKFSFTIKIKE